MFLHLLHNLGIGYVCLDGTEADLWRQAARHAPLAYRRLGRSVTIKQLDASLGESPAWLKCKQNLARGDVIWPFSFNRNASSMREGFVVIRAGRPITGLLTIVS